MWPDSIGDGHCLHLEAGRFDIAVRRPDSARGPIPLRFRFNGYRGTDEQNIIDSVIQPGGGQAWSATLSGDL